MADRNIFTILFGYLHRYLMPDFLVALYFMYNFHCRISLSTKFVCPQRIQIGKGARIDACSLICGPEGKIEIGESCEIGYGSIIDTQGKGCIKIADHAAIGPYVVIYGRGGVNIGQHTMIAAHSTVVASSHIFHETHIPIRQQGTSYTGIDIQQDVWCGAHCVVLDGSIIEKGAVIGAGSIVKGHINSYSINTGMPAKQIKKRQQE